MIKSMGVSEEIPKETRNRSDPEMDGEKKGSDDYVPTNDVKVVDFLG